MHRYRAVYVDGETVEGAALDLGRFVVDLASGPRGPSDLVAVVDVDHLATLQAPPAPETEEPDKKGRRK